MIRSRGRSSRCGTLTSGWNDVLARSAADLPPGVRVLRAAALVAATLGGIVVGLTAVRIGQADVRGLPLRGALRLAFLTGGGLAVVAAAVAGAALRRGASGASGCWPQCRPSSRSSALGSTAPRRHLAPVGRSRSTCWGWGCYRRFSSSCRRERGVGAASRVGTRGSRPRVDHEPSAWAAARRLRPSASLTVERVRVERLGQRWAGGAHRHEGAAGGVRQGSRACAPCGQPPVASRARDPAIVFVVLGNCLHPDVRQMPSAEVREIRRDREPQCGRRRRCSQRWHPGAQRRLGAVWSGADEDAWIDLHYEPVRHPRGRITDILDVSGDDRDRLTGDSRARSCSKCRQRRASIRSRRPRRRPRTTGRRPAGHSEAPLRLHRSPHPQVEHHVGIRALEPAREFPEQSLRSEDASSSRPPLANHERSA
jgi:hypothetical protein